MGSVDTESQRIGVRAYRAPDSRRNRTLLSGDGCVPSNVAALCYMGIKSVAATSAQWPAWRVGCFWAHCFVEIALHHVAFKPFVIAFDPVPAIDGLELFRHLPRHLKKSDAGAHGLVFNRLSDSKLKRHDVSFPVRHHNTTSVKAALDARMASS